MTSDAGRRNGEGGGGFGASAGRAAAKEKRAPALQITRKARPPPQQRRRLSPGALAVVRLVALHPLELFDTRFIDVISSASTRMKVVVKGIMTAEDAELAATCADAIVVSNHGGRQLDGCGGCSLAMSASVAALSADGTKLAQRVCQAGVGQLWGRCWASTLVCSLWWPPFLRL